MHEAGIYEKYPFRRRIGHIYPLERLDHIYPFKGRRIGHIYPLERVGVNFGRKGEDED